MASNKIPEGFYEEYRRMREEMRRHYVNPQTGHIPIFTFNDNDTVGIRRQNSDL